MTAPDDALAALQRTLEDLPRRMAEAEERVAAAAAAEVSAQDPGGLVTVVASGAGEIRSVRVSDRARHDLKPGEAADRIAAAVNAALSKAEAALSEAAGPAPFTADDTSRQVAAFESRMDDLLDRLNRLDRDLQDRLDT